MFESAAPEPEIPKASPIASLYHGVVDEIRSRPQQALEIAALVGVGALTVYALQGRVCSLADPEFSLYKGIGEFGTDGKLAAGLHQASFEEFARRFGTNPARMHLLEGFQALAHNVGSAGCDEIRIGGSFVTNKAVPLDFDALWRFTKAVDESKLDATLLTDSRFDTRYKFGGDVYSTRTKKLNFGNILPKHKSIFRWLSEDAEGPVGVVSIDPKTVPAPKDFHPYSFGERLDAPDWLRKW